MPINAKFSPADGTATIRCGSGMWPLSDRIRVQGALFLNPPIGVLGRNLPALGGTTLTLVYSWS